MHHSKVVAMVKPYHWEEREKQKVLEDTISLAENKNTLQENITIWFAGNTEKITIR